MSTYEKFAANEKAKAELMLERAGNLKTLAYVLYAYREFLTHSKLKKFIQSRRYEIEQRATHQSEQMEFNS